MKHMMHQTTTVEESLRGRRNSRTWIAVLLASLAMGMACAAEPDLGAWRAELIRQQGMTPVKGVRVTPAEKKAVWQAFRKQFGDMRVQMGRTTCVATNETRKMYNQEILCEHSERRNLGLSVSAKGACAWVYQTSTCVGQTVAENELVAQFEQLGVGFPGIVSAPPSAMVFERGKTSIRRKIRGGGIMAPFDRFRIFFIDDNPNADWTHQARLLFLSEDLKSWCIIFVNEPVAIEVSGSEIELSVERNGDEKVSTAKSQMSVRGFSSVDSPQGSGYSPIEDDAADASRCYALLVCGGVDRGNNHCRYWKEMCFVYNVLRLRYCLPRTNIKVLWASGNPGVDLCCPPYCRSGCRTGYDFTRLSDFDEDGNDDINGAATKKNVLEAFAGYEKTLTEQDQLFVFFTDHGDGDADGKASVCLWGWATTTEPNGISDVEFANATRKIRCPVIAALKTCYSGGMISEFVNSAPNRVMATADGFDPSNGYVWTHNFFGALCGQVPSGLSDDGSEKARALYVDPRRLTGRCAADANGDGRISIEEASEYAKAKNPWPDEESPNCQCSPVSTGISGRLFLTQYSDIGPLVRGKVLTPTLDPRTNVSLFAPYVVKVSCGTSDATIRYTFDGSEPVNGSPCCEHGKNEIVITKDCTLCVRAFKSDMDPSDVVRAGYKVRKTAPEKASIMSVSQSDSTTGIVISWLVGDGTESVDILRSENERMTGKTVVKSGLSSTEMTYADMTAVPGRSYYYQILARNAYGTSVSGVSLEAVRALSVPEIAVALSGSAGLSSAKVKVSWTAVAGASHYRVFRKDASGSPVPISGWLSTREFTDAVSYSNGGAAFAYYVQAAADGNGRGASEYSKEASISVVYDLSGASLVICHGSKDTEGLTAVAVKAGGTATTCYCKLKNANGTFEEEGFTSKLTWDLVEGSGIGLNSRAGSYSSSGLIHALGGGYTAPSVDISHLSGTGKCKVRVSYSIGGKTVSRELLVVKTTADIVKTLVVDSPDFAVPGEIRELSAYCTLYGGSSWREDIPEETPVRWSISSGEGVTLSEDGELTAWPVSKKTAVIIQATVDTPLGPVCARQTVSVSPSVVAKMRAVIPPTGGESENYVARIDSTTYGEWIDADWINGITYYGSDYSTYNNKNWTIRVGKGRNQIALVGKEMFVSFRADRNAGTVRSGMFKLRWDGGGVDFQIEQQPAPVAATPNVSVASDGLSASAQGDGSVVRYATDGEEPSENSPVLNGKVSFGRNTPVAVKAFGDWMQKSETVYGDVEGGEKVTTVNIRFDPVETSVKVPPDRIYKVTDVFGELPMLAKEGLFFHGWTLYKGSSKRVSESDYVPGQDAVLYARWSKVPEDDPEWTALPWNFKSSATGFVKVYDRAAGTWLPSAVVGVEDAAGECRGSSKNGFGDWQDKRNGVDGICVFGIFGTVETGSECGLKFRVWMPGSGYAIVLNDDVPYVAETELGSAENPYVLNIMSVAVPTVVDFDANGGVGKMTRQTAEFGGILKLAKCTLTHPKGKRFAGWSCSNGRRYDDEMLVFNLGSVKMTAIWE